MANTSGSTPGYQGGPLYQSPAYGRSGLKGFSARVMVGNLDRSGYSEFDSGTALADEGVAGVRGSLADYQASLKSGRYLPSNVYRAYDLARGGVADTAARDINAGNASVKQQALASGGFLSPEAQAEYGSINARGVHDQEFNALTGIDTSEASAEQAGATDLMNRVDSLKTTILNAGQFRQTLAQQKQVEALHAQLHRGDQLVKALHFW
jgi:hypothetical protein